MLHLKKMTRRQIRVTAKNNEHHYTTFEDVKEPLRMEDIEFKDLGEIEFHTYSDLLHYISTELITIAEEIEVDTYVLNGKNTDDTFKYVLYNGDEVELSSFTLGYRVRVTIAEDNVVDREIDF